MTKNNISNNRRKWLSFLLLPAVLSCLFFTLSCEKNPVVVPPDPPPLPPIRVDSLSNLELKISKMFLVGVAGTGPSLTDDMVKLVKDLKVGGIILFEKWGNEVRNVKSKEQVTALAANLKKEASGYNLLIAIDQEGGKVCRLKPEYGYLPTVQAGYIGSINNPDTTAFYADRIADMVVSSNINMNCAPVADVNVNPASPAIGGLGRSFSSDPLKVAEMIEVFYDKQAARGVISVFKHFPGHGSALADSHNGFTDVSNTWKEYELDPYKIMIGKKKCDAIMTAHVFNANLDPQYPATLSHKIITDLLRGELKYDGVVISDDMGMGAITQNWAQEEALALGINAGVDMFIISSGKPTDFRILIKKIADMVSSGKIKESRINEAYGRITKLSAKVAVK